MKIVKENIFHFSFEMKCLDRLSVAIVQNALLETVPRFTAMFAMFNGDV